VETDPEAANVDEKLMPLCRSGDLSALWKDSGLERVREGPLEINIRFGSFAEYWQPFLLGQGPAGAYVRTLDEAGRAKLQASIQRRIPVSK
jgi:hypothetical protein